MLTNEEKRIVACIVDGYAADEVAYQLLVSFKHNIHPNLYIYAGYLIAEKAIKKPKQISILNFNN